MIISAGTLGSYEAKKRAELGSGEDVRTFPSFPVLNDSGFYVKRLCVWFFGLFFFFMLMQRV